jgi:hypothetical protein
MKSRVFFRESGYPIRTRTRFDPWWVVAALTVVMAFYGLGWWIDHSEPLAEARGYAAGQADTLVHLRPMLARAFDAGINEGQVACSGGAVQPVRP